MESRLFATAELAARQVADEIRDCLMKNPAMHLCIAAGDTSLPLFQILIKEKEAGHLDFTKCRFTAMDEWAGMNDTDKDSCGNFLQRHFLRPSGFLPENVRLFNGRADDLTKECERMKAVLTRRGALDYLVLGMGMNGHLALNEPGTDPTLSVHISQLDDITKQVGQKYFHGEKAPLWGGITIGLSDMKKAKRTVLLVSGAHKHTILHRLLTEEPHRDLPASYLKTFEHTAVFYDQMAWSGTKL